jgi:hypothetical protein
LNINQLEDIVSGTVTLVSARFPGFIQPLTEMSTGIIKRIMFSGSKVQPVRGADNLTAIYEPIVLTMWDP